MYKDSYSLHFGSSITKVVKYLIIINVVAFILTGLLKIHSIYAAFALTPVEVTRTFFVWQLLTYMFVHSGLWHILINMLMLYFFGPGLEAVWGPKRFLYYYLLTGIGAGICSVLTSFNSSIPIVGASGAIFGLLVAYAIVFPETVVLVFFLFPMKIKYAVWLFGAINLFSALSNPGSGIAYFAHIGGGLTGYLYLKREKLFYKIGQMYLRSKARSQEKERREKEDLNLKIDEILDKISRHGLDSLTKKEKKILKDKSRETK